MGRSQRHIRETIRARVSDVEDSNGFTYDEARGVSGSSVAAEATALIARMTSAPNSTRQGHINTLITSLKNAGVWTKLDALYLTAAHDTQAARLNWKSTSYTLTAVGTPTYTTDRGVSTLAAGSYFDSGFNPSTAGGVFVQNSAHLGYWAQTDADAVHTGQFGVGNLNSTLRHKSASNTAAQIRMNAGSTITTSPFSSGVRRHYALNRNNSANFDGWSAGVKEISALASTSAAPSSLTFGVLARQSAAATWQVDSSGVRYAAFHWGSALSDAEMLALYNALNTYLVALGAA